MKLNNLMTFLYKLMGFYILLLTYPESKTVKKMGRKFQLWVGVVGRKKEEGRKKYGKNKEVINGEYNDYLKIKLLVCCGNKKQTLPIFKCYQMEKIHTKTH